MRESPAQPRAKACFPAPGPAALRRASPGLSSRSQRQYRDHLLTFIAPSLRCTGEVCPLQVALRVTLLPGQAGLVSAACFLGSFQELRLLCPYLKETESGFLWGSSLS